MTTLVRHAFVEIRPVVIDARTAVIGYDVHSQQPVLDRGSGPVALSDVQRGAWDAGEEAFTPEVEAKIEAAIQHLRRP